LENAPVRAAAVTALAKFGVHLGGDVQQNTLVLLKRCRDDPDDEVRDRAVMYLKLLEESAESESAQYNAKTYVTDNSTFAFETLEKQLVSYQSDKAQLIKPFDLKTAPIVTKAQEEAERKREYQTRDCHNENDAPKGTLAKLELRSTVTHLAQASGMLPSKPSTGGSGNASPTTASHLSAGAGAAEPLKTNYASLLESMPQFTTFGPLLRSSKPVELTEVDVAEYVVSCVKHIFAQHVVLQVCV
jgi:coatomer protein complex subunit gamma